jgi:poly-gamma-glutamate synthesis protein (capsule biosynthesis protein)
MRLLEPSGDVRLRLAALGDVGVVGSARRRAGQHGYERVLAPVKERLRAADVGFANLEFPVAEPGWIEHPGSREQWHDVRTIAGLASAGVTHLSLANNHVLDAGQRGLEATWAACERAGVRCVGAGLSREAAERPVEFDVRGRRVALFARAEGRRARAAGTAQVATLEVGPLREMLAHWRPRCDILLLSAHWGSMYIDYPPPRVMQLARICAEEGVDLVLGHHPHVLQGVKQLDATLVLFSIGDAVFDPRSGEFEARVAKDARRLGALFDIEIAKRHGVNVTPFRLDDDGLPCLADATRAGEVMRRLERLTAGLNDAEQQFAAQSAPMLLQYELQSLGEYVRKGRLDRVVALLASVRLRHLPVLWQAVRRMGRTS